MKVDLVKLCHLLHLTVDPKDTVDVLKGKIKPMLAILKIEPEDKSKAKSVAAPSRPEPKALAPPPRLEEASSVVPVAPMNPGVTHEELNNMMNIQEERFQAMITQTMQAVVSVNAANLQMTMEPTHQDEEMVGGDAAWEWTRREK